MSIKATEGETARALLGEVVAAIRRFGFSDCWRCRSDYGRDYPHDGDKDRENALAMVVEAETFLKRTAEAYEGKHE